MSVLYIRIFFVREYRNWLLCLSYSKWAFRENHKVLSDVSSLFICRQEIYVRLRKKKLWEGGIISTVGRRTIL